MFSNSSPKQSDLEWINSQFNQIDICQTLLTSELRSREPGPLQQIPVWKIKPAPCSDIVPPVGKVLYIGEKTVLHLTIGKN